MKRDAFLMKLKPGCQAEYKRRHDSIWPDLQRELKLAGISDYSIYLDEATLLLFAVWKLTEDNTIAHLPKSPVMQKWWDYMRDLMEVNPDNSPLCVPIKEVFHLD